MKDKPQILTLNLQSKSLLKLEEKKYNFYSGTLGKLINTNNKQGELKYCLLNNDYPANLHEYDLLIVDLDHVEKIDYIENENRRTENKTGNNKYLLSKYPQTIFDPRPLASHMLVGEIQELTKHESIIVAFQSEFEIISYTIVEENEMNHRNKGVQEHNIYELIPQVPFQSNKSGKETKIQTNISELKSFLDKYNEEFTYECTFYHPTHWETYEQVLDPDFHPLVINKDNEIVSYAIQIDKSLIFVFPKLPDTSNFIIEFLENVGPSVLPKLFPSSKLNAWKNNKEYFLPNHNAFLAEKEELLLEWEKRDKAIDEKIEKNLAKFKFLHDILSESGDELVHAVIEFLRWLEFDNVKDMDEESIEIKEEDIQIETNKGLLVIEVKGISGTSKDSECSQISKIKYRRSKERGSFDVYGLYIVNHRKHLPPFDRESPPFTKEQISDALNDERGLMTTVQLFNLYFDITNDIITKEEAREIFFNYGLLSFQPTELKFVDQVDEIFLGGQVSIINLTDTTLKKGDIIYVEKNGRFEKTVIQEIKLNDSIVEEIDNGEVGIKTDKKIKRKSSIWIRTGSNSSQAPAQDHAS